MTHIFNGRLSFKFLPLKPKHLPGSLEKILQPCMDLSLIIPSYNSADVLGKNIPVLIDFLSTLKYSWEIIVVDDQSNDDGKTEQIARKLNCVFVKHPVNMGKGASVRSGMLAAKGKFRIFTDADIPFKLNSIDEFVQYLDFKEFDVVVGDRTLASSVYFSEISRRRKWSSSVFSFIVGRFITTGMFDTQCGIKGFRSEVAQDLFSVSRINGFAFDVEIIYISLKRNYDIKRLPVVLRNDEGTTVRVWKHAVKMVYDIFRIKWNQVTGKYETKKIKPL